MQQSDRNKGAVEQIGEQLGEMAGRAAGQAADLTANVMGSIFGSAMNWLGDWWSSPSADQAARSFGQEQDMVCRRHHEGRSPTGTNRSYEEVRPLYQFGHTAGQNPDYQGRSFEEIESHLERACDEEQTTRFGTWPEARDYVSYGYTQRSTGGAASGGSGTTGTPGGMTGSGGGTAGTAGGTTGPGTSL